MNSFDSLCEGKEPINCPWINLQNTSVQLNIESWNRLHLYKRGKHIYNIAICFSMEKFMKGTMKVVGLGGARFASS